MARQRWSSQVVFVFAAIGSAVGLGNVWRFPYLAGKYGGGAFLLPYGLALFLLGVPLLIMEIGLGQRLQKAAVASFQRVGASLGGIGLAAVTCAFFIACYYAVVMAWSWIYLFRSFDLPWAGQSKEFFQKIVLHLAESPDKPGSFVPSIVLGLAVTWVAVYACIRQGVKSVGKVVMVTMPLPVILLVVLLLRGVTLSGFEEGLAYFLLPDLSALFDEEVWTAAVSQIFFTLTLAVGVMIAYGSYQPTGAEIVRTAVVISLTNSAVSILAGLAVFSNLGHMAVETGQEVAALAASGPSLAFVIFPEALAFLPGAVLFSILFFVMLISLGIDSLFSLVEAAAGACRDFLPANVSHQAVAFVLCALGFLGGLPFCLQGGVYYLDVVDHFVTEYGLIIVGIAQCVALGWFGPVDELVEGINSVSSWKIGVFWKFIVQIVAPVCLSALLLTSFRHDWLHAYGNYPASLLFVGWGTVLVVLLALVVGVFAKRTS